MDNEDKLDLIISDIQYIKGILEDNPRTGQKGIVGIAIDLEKRVSKIEVTDRVRMGKVGVVGVIFGLIGANIGRILTLLSKIAV